MEKLVWGIIFSMEVLKYILGEKIFFHKEIERKWAGYVGLLIYMCVITFMPMMQKNQSLMRYVFAIATVFFMLHWKKTEELVNFLILFIEVTCIEGVTEKLLAAIGQKTEYADIAIEYQLLVSGAVVTAMFSAVYFVCKRKRARDTKIRIEYMWILVLFMVVNMLFTAAGLYYTKEYVTNQRLQFFMTMTNVCSYISVGLVVLFITYIKNTNQKLQQLLITEKQLKEAQEQYYCSLLKKEEETRRNRHDWNNHLICIAELAQRENTDNIKKYIDTLIKQNTYQKDRQYDVGNDILNAILCHHLSELGDDILIKVLGKCKGNINIDAADLCVIVSNLVQNAVEYLKSSNIQNKMLSFTIEEGSAYKRITIINSIGNDASERNFKKTTKSDKKNHGIGLQNVRETIERNGGEFKINIKDGICKAEVIWK